MIPIDLRAHARRRRALRAAAVAALCAAAGASAQGDAPVTGRAPDGVSLVTQHVIAGGGVTRASSACFDLAGTVAEPVAGSAQGGSFRLDAGFLALPVATDSLFRTSFEVCQP
jgi:hypothetical protein